MMQTTWSVTGIASALLCYSAFKSSPYLSPTWTSRYARFSVRDRIDWDSRFASTLHAVAISSLAAYLFLATDTFRDDTSNPELKGVPLQLRTTTVSDAALGFSLGYFVLDIVLMLKHYPYMGGAEMLAHHIAAFFSVFAAAAQGQAHMYTLIMLATEVTTPFVNARWMFDKLAWRHRSIYLWNGVLMFVSWFLVRIVMFLWFFKHEWDHRTDTRHLTWPSIVLITVVPLLLFVLNMFWFSKIIRGLLRLISGQLKQHDDLGPRMRYRSQDAAAQLKQYE